MKDFYTLYSRNLLNNLIKKTFKIGMQTKFLTRYARAVGLPDKNNPHNVFQWTWFPFDIAWPPAYCKNRHRIKASLLDHAPHHVHRFRQQISGPHVENPPHVVRWPRPTAPSSSKNRSGLITTMRCEKVIKVHSSSAGLQAASESRAVRLRWWFTRPTANSSNSAALLPSWKRILPASASISV